MLSWLAKRGQQRRGNKLSCTDLALLSTCQKDFRQYSRRGEKVGHNEEFCKSFFE